MGNKSSKESARNPYIRGVESTTTSKIKRWGRFNAPTRTQLWRDGEIVWDSIWGQSCSNKPAPSFPCHPTL